MKNVFRRMMSSLLALLTMLMLVLSPAVSTAADSMTIEELGEKLWATQISFDETNASYEEVCALVAELDDTYQNGTEKQQLAVQDKLIEALMNEEELYEKLAQCEEELTSLLTLHAEMLEDAKKQLRKHTVKTKGYDSTLTIEAQLDEYNVIWSVTVEVKGNKDDAAVAENSFLLQFIGRMLPLDVKDDEIELIPTARKTSQAVVDALNGLVEEEQKKSSGPIIEPQDIADYIFQHGELPDNFITKKEAQKMGWDSSYNYVSDVAPGYSIGGDRFGNYEGLLPDKKGRTWYEADCYYTKGKRNAHRILFSNDGLVYYTDDHYESFTQMFPSK